MEDDKNIEVSKNEYILKLEYILTGTNLIQFLAIFIVLPIYANSIPKAILSCVMAVSFVAFLASCLFAVKIEVDTGYYECQKCGHCYVPTYKKALLAPHSGRNRYMICPECSQKSWQKKVLTKN